VSNKFGRESVTGFKWYLGIQTVILEITWFIMLWWAIHAGGFGLWAGWFVCTLVCIFSSVCFAASILGSFDEYCDLNREVRELERRGQ